MDNNHEVQDFDLDDILNEFHEAESDVSADVEADEELKELLDLPQLTITPVVVKTSEAMSALLQEEAPEETPDEPTMVFAPVAEEDADTAEIPDDDTHVLPAQELTEEAPPAVEPAFEVPEEFIPSPILFQPRSRLKELKKQLVAGPEKRFYALSEIGVGKLQAAIAVNLAVVALCILVTTLYAMDMIPANRLRLVIFSQVLAVLVSGLLGIVGCCIICIIISSILYSCI